MKLFLPVAVILSCLSPFCLDVATNYARTRNVQAQDRSGKNKEEELTPLTEAERQLNPHDIVIAQPDFVADLALFASEGFGAHSWAEHIARKGRRYRKESQFWVFIGEIGKTSVRLYPQGKVYDDFVPPRGGGLAEGGVYDPGSLALESDVAFTAQGTVQIDGHKCIKIEAVRKGEPEKIYLYAASDLKNLIIVAQVLAEKRSLVERLRNVSLDVPDYLVEIPSDFKPIEHDRWTKLESAKLTYKGNPSNDFGVFRAPGGELFIWVRDAYYPWEYLYRPQEGTVEIAFQGLLVNPSGTYIWQTKDTEAFSVINYHSPHRSLIDAYLVVKPNGIGFRSNSYKQDQATIDIAW